MENITIRKASVEDAKDILNIYSFYVENTSITFEYDVPTEEEFRERISNTLIKYPYFVALIDGEIVGYAYLSAFRVRAAYMYSAETSIYVKKDIHSKGVGTLLYSTLEEAARKQGIVNLNACITFPNEKSETFHRKFGYKKAAHFTKCGYKFNRWCDVIWMEKHIGEHSIPPKKFISFSDL